jgi:uncharacterized membrane protein HdeD (DUF308 family)
MTDIASQLGLEPHALAGKWGWFVGLGIVMILAGFFAFADTVLVTLLSVIFIGAALLVTGAFQIVHAFANKDWGAFAFALLCGALYIAGGLLIMDEPEHGSVIITILLLVALSVGGALRIAMALRHREIAGWWLLLLGGLVSIFLSVFLFMGLPWTSFWLLGTIIAVELIFHGVGWIRMGLALREMR